MVDRGKMQSRRIREYYSGLKKKLVNIGTPGICLDIDDTIAATNVFYAEKYSKMFGSPQGLSPQEIIDKYRYAMKVPNWSSRHMQDTIDKDFKTGNHIDLTSPTLHARESISKIEEIVPISFYLTGRPDKFYTQTEKWLIRNDFPTREIIMQPDESVFEEVGITNTHKWKAQLLDFLHPEVLGIIDDNYDLIKEISPKYKGSVFLYSHGKSDNNQQNIIHCPDWKDVIREASDRLGSINK